jgi:hypothetical protein
MNWRSVIPNQKTENDVCLPTWIRLRCRFLSYALLPLGQKASRADCNSRSSNSVNGRRTPFFQGHDVSFERGHREQHRRALLLSGSNSFGRVVPEKTPGDIAMSKLVPANYLVECAQNENRSFENRLNGQRLEGSAYSATSATCMKNDEALAG